MFDQLFDGKEDLRPLPLVDRKARLEAHVETAPANIRYVDHFITAGDAVLLVAVAVPAGLLGPWLPSIVRNWSRLLTGPDAGNIKLVHRGV